MRQTSKATVSKARSLRRSTTPPEARLWQLLRQRPGGLKFRRQHPAGRYILDFYCASARLAIEIDGVAHDMGDNPARDLRRDAWLKGKGFCVLRIPAAEIMNDANAVVAHILNHCSG
ncbi:endonuclease domain-containing protein [Sphingosinicella sp.]|uniref:endonuclease domain-containing protein n=1 Tax=Sphingosinicella sp. TaxID=1917971 RepID=UPI0040382D1A